MIELIASPQQIKFSLDKRDTLLRYYQDCEVRFACHGECPKNVSYALRMGSRDSIARAPTTRPFSTTSTVLCISWQTCCAEGVMRTR